MSTPARPSDLANHGGGLVRTLEPEVMDTASEAEDYDAMDHASVNNAFCTDFLATAPDVSRVLDVGTGTARIPIELVKRSPEANVVGTDLADHMLRVARVNIEAAGLASRIALEKTDAKGMTFEACSFSSVICNTILHHIPDPTAAIADMVRVLARGGTLFVRDLVRPENESALDALSALHGGAPDGSSPVAVESHARQLELFRASLCASFTLAEIRAMVVGLGVEASAVTLTSDRHWTLAWKKPA